MTNVLLLFTLSLAAATSSGIPDSKAEPPAVVTAGLKAYESGGADAAIKAWLAGSPAAGGKDSLTLVSNLRGIEDLLGKYQSAKVVKNFPFTSDCRLTYVQMNYAKGPLFAKFLTYKVGSEWVVESLKIHTDPEMVWPWELLGSSENR